MQDVRPLALVTCLLLVDLAPAARDFLGPLVNGDAAWPEADDGRRGRSSRTAA
jgi:hypothetical protein